ncbi:MAG: RES family NAD+ phosphorylase [Opitutaceae bacterium]|nr:RES family NAD+ phosphorylase [Opitutaceae bacterium]
MKPPGEWAVEGRVNPKGIPCLYVASEEKTVISEVRPWIGEYVSVARLRTVRSLKVVNCTGDEKERRVLLYAKPPSPDELKRAVWHEIDLAFAKPVERTDCFASYAPTQVLAEAFREIDFDGIAYRSNFGGGYNVAFFDLNAAEVVGQPWVVRVSTLDVGFERVS